MTSTNNTKGRLPALALRLVRCVRALGLRLGALDHIARWVRRALADFRHVRRNANRPLEGIKHYADGSASFTMQRSTIEYAEACDRLPKPLLRLALATALKPNTRDDRRRAPDSAQPNGA